MMGWVRLTVIVGSLATLVTGTAAVVAGADKITNSTLFDLASRSYVDGRVTSVNTQLAAELEQRDRTLRTISLLTSEAHVSSTALLLKSARNDLAAAERDLVSAPTLQSLQQTVEELQSEVEELEAALQMAKCIRTEAISGQDHRCRQISTD